MRVVVEEVVIELLALQPGQLVPYPAVFEGDAERLEVLELDAEALVEVERPDGHAAAGRLSERLTLEAVQVGLRSQAKDPEEGGGPTRA